MTPFAIEIADRVLTEGALDAAAMQIATEAQMDVRRSLADFPGGPTSRELLRATVRAALTNLIAAGRIEPASKEE